MLLEYCVNNRDRGRGVLDCVTTSGPVVRLAVFLAMQTAALLALDLSPALACVIRYCPSFYHGRRRCAWRHGMCSSREDCLRAMLLMHEHQNIVIVCKDAEHLPAKLPAEDGESSQRRIQPVVRSANETTCASRTLPTTPSHPSLVIDNHQNPPLPALYM